MVRYNPLNSCFDFATIWNFVVSRTVIVPVFLDLDQPKSFSSPGTEEDFGLIEGQTGHLETSDNTHFM